MEDKESIDWFRSIDNKKKKTFFKFDIEAYFPSISKALLIKAFEFVDRVNYLDEFEKNLIMHCRRGVLVGKDQSIWVKTADANFDITMGSKDSAEISEMVGLYLLDKLSEHFPKEDLGLYRDDGLGACEGGGPEFERLKKKLVKIFREEGLKITVEGGEKSVDFLDVMFDLNSGKYCPYIKPNTTTHYVSTQSNHPPAVLKSITKGISKRLSCNSSTKEEFQAHTGHFRDALKEAGYVEDIKYVEEEARGKKKNRKRRVIYFNPPWSANVSINIGARF